MDGREFEALVARELPQILGDLFDVAPEAVQIENSPTSSIDLQVSFRDESLQHQFFVECRHSGAAAPVAAAIDRLPKPRSDKNWTFASLLVVPYMGEVGSRLCREAGICWLDLSGNARIVVASRPPTRIIVEGKPNRFKSPGRPSDPFAPKSARIARHLLVQYPNWMTQRQISQVTQVSEGFVSQVVHRLEADGLVIRAADGSVRPVNPDLLLDAWRESYDFRKHRIIEAHVMSRSSELLLEELAHRLQRKGWDHAFTGLAGAWAYVPFASYRLTTVYVRDPSGPLLEEHLAQALEDLSFRAHARAPNLWIVLPQDDGVFDGAGPAGRKKVPCAHPVQVFLDLKNHPERSEEAAAELRKHCMPWRSNG